MNLAGDLVQKRADAAASSPDFEVKNLVDLYLHQSSSVNQLWTTYVVATFAGATFAITAGKEGSPFLLYAGAVGFLAFTVGHFMLVRSGLDRMKLAAEDIGGSLKGSVRSRALDRLARPVFLWPSFTCHIIIDLCVLAAFAYRIVG